MSTGYSYDLTYILAHEVMPPFIRTISCSSLPLKTKPGNNKQLVKEVAHMDLKKT